MLLWINVSFLNLKGCSSGYEGTPVLFYTTCLWIGCPRRNFALGGFKCENVSLLKSFEGSEG